MTRLAKVTIVTTDLEFVTHVPNRQVNWNDERNGDGYGRLKIPTLDGVLVRHPELVTDDGFIVALTLHDHTTPFFGFRIEKPSEVIDSEEEGGGRWVQLEGRGGRALLQGTIIFPEKQGPGQPFPLRDTLSDERPTTFASDDGPWKVDAEWVIPEGDPQGTHNSYGSLGIWPTAWPDPAAKWIWSTDPTADADLGTNWFRGYLTLAEDTSLGIWMCGDNRILAFYVDGELIHADEFDELYGWKKTAYSPISLPAGEHVFAAAVENRSGAGGFLCTVGTLTAEEGELDDVLLRTDTDGSWEVRGYGDPPGWTAGQIMVRFVQDSQARDEIPSVTLNFNNAIDSAGLDWPEERINRTWRIGSDLLDVLDQLIERGYDAEMTPALVLRLWANRGTDRSATVRLSSTVSPTRQEPASDRTQIRNRVLVRYAHGWVMREDADSIDAYGVRSISITAGDANTPKEANAVGDAFLRDHAWPLDANQVSLSSRSGPQPYEDFFMADQVTAKTLMSARQKQTVIGIGGEETDVDIRWVITLDPEG